MRSSRVLLVRAGALGDLLLLRRTLASLRRAGAEVTLLVPGRPGSVLVGPGLEEASALLRWDGPAVARLLSGSAPNPADEVGTFDVALCYSRNRNLHAALGGVAPRVVSHDPEPGTSEHASVWLAQPLAALGVPSIAPASLTPTEEETGRIRSLLSRLPPDFLAVHPGSGSPSKNWPLDRFADLVRRVSAGREWLLALGPAEGDCAGLSSLPGAVLVHEPPPRELGALLAHAAIYVGNDSGVSHLAAAYGAPTVALFGPTDPAVWGPVGVRVRTLRAADARMESIEVQEVEAAIAGLRIHHRDTGAAERN